MTCPDLDALQALPGENRSLYKKRVQYLIAQTTIALGERSVSARQYNLRPSLSGRIFELLPDLRPAHQQIVAALWAITEINALKMEE